MPIKKYIPGTTFGPETIEDLTTASAAVECAAHQSQRWLERDRIAGQHYATYGAGWLRLVKKFLSVFSRLAPMNVVTQRMSQHDRNNIASSLTFVLVRNEISSPITMIPSA